VDDVKQWAHFLHTKEGGDYPWKKANNVAFYILKEKKRYRYKLDDVKELTQHFNSTDASDYSDSPGWRARDALNVENPPKVDDVKQWAHFLHAKEGGDYPWKRANEVAFYILEKKLVPKLDDVKELTKQLADPESEPAIPVETTPQPVQMLDCDPPQKPRYGDLTRHVCKEGQNKIQHGHRCSPVCSLGTPQPATLICDNGVIGSFECLQGIDH